MTEKKSSEKKDVWLKVFCPEARCLTEEEVASLPEKKVKMTQPAGVKGIWLEMPVPEGWKPEPRDASEQGEEGEGKKEKGFWLKLFCPEDECVLEQPTDVP
jgi:hypothetical protein